MPCIISDASNPSGPVSSTDLQITLPGFARLRSTTVVLIAATLVMNGLAIQSFADERIKSGLDPGRRRLIRWLDRQTPRPSVVTTGSFALSAVSQSNYHWILCRHGSDQTRRLLRDAGANYVVVFAKERSCNFIRDLRDELRLVKQLGKDGRIRVWELADPTDPPTRTPKAAL